MGADPSRCKMHSSEEAPGLAREMRYAVEEDFIQEQSSLIATVQRHTSGAYSKRPIAIVRGQGVMLYDADGREYLDMTSGQGVALLGHSHPAVVQAIGNQANRLITCPQIFFNDQRAALYQQLVAHLPEGLERFFLCNSGAEAVEGAIKVARLLTRRPGIIAMRGGFHGRTLGALSATWEARLRRPFEPLVPGFQHIPYNDAEAAELAIDNTTAAVILEVVQGESGVHLAQGNFLKILHKLCQERGALLIFDEIQTGLGRTGRWFAGQHYGVTPDVMCLEKGIAGGLPMGVVVWRSELGTLTRGSHGSTFGGNPLVCAAALATLRTLEAENLPERAALTGERLIRRLRGMNHPMVREVRGQGLMIGIELRQRVTPALKALMERGVLTLSSGRTTLRLLPPLIVEDQTLGRVEGAIEDVLEEVYGDNG